MKTKLNFGWVNELIRSVMSRLMHAQGVCASFSVTEDSPCLQLMFNTNEIQI